MFLRIGIFLASGVLTGLSFNLPLLSLVAWISLFPSLYVLPRSGRKEAVIVGFIFGVSFYLTTLFWVGEVSKLGLFFLVFYLALYPTLFFVGARYFLTKRCALISIPCLWVMLESLQESVWCGFGWANIGYSQFRNLYLVQVADIIGAKGISFIVVMVNMGFYEVVHKKRESVKKILCILLLLSLCIMYGTLRLKNLTSAKTLAVSLVQPNIAQELKWQEGMQPVIIDELQRLAKQTPSRALVVFPEAAWPYILSKQMFPYFTEAMKEIKKELLIGAVQQVGERYYNTALLLDQQGVLQQAYRKIRLVPFGEYVPLRNFLGFIGVINAIGDMERGHHYTRFVSGGITFSVLICFEDIFPLFVARFSRGCDMMVNITNDGWFGGNPQAQQHLGIMVMRAIENRISIARCANTGISGWVSFRGEVETFKKDEKEIGVAGTEDFSISLRQQRSFYNRWPQAVPFLSGLFLIGATIIPRQRKSLRQSSPTKG